MQLFNQTATSIYKQCDPATHNGFVLHHLVPRAKNFALVGLELLATFENICLMPLQLGKASLKEIIAKPLCRFNPESKKWKKLDRSLPGMDAFVTTSQRALGFFVGSVMTLVLGTLSPYTNLQLHKKAHLYPILSPKAIKAERLFQKECARLAQIECFSEGPEELLELAAEMDYEKIAKTAITHFNNEQGMENHLNDSLRESTFQIISGEKQEVVQEQTCELQQEVSEKHPKAQVNPNPMGWFW